MLLYFHFLAYDVRVHIGHNIGCKHGCAEITNVPKGTRQPLYPGQPPIRRLSGLARHRGCQRACKLWVGTCSSFGEFLKILKDSSAPVWTSALDQYFTVLSRYTVY